MSHSSEIVLQALDCEDMIPMNRCSSPDPFRFVAVVHAPMQCMTADENEEGNCGDLIFKSAVL